MQFSDTSTKLGIIQACERYTNKGDAAISGNATLLAEFTAHINEIQRRVWNTIFSSYGGWQYDDSNQTDLPSASATITADQTSYSIPTGALTIRGIEVKNTGSVWTRLAPLTEEMIRERQAMGEFFKTSGSPQYFQLVGDSIRLYPASNYTQASSFKVFFDRGSVAFASGDTTKTAGFASEYHGILPLGAALEYLKIKLPGDGTTAQLRADYQEMMMNLSNYYSKRYLAMFPPRIRVRDAMQEAV